MSPQGKTNGKGGALGTLGQAHEVDMALSKERVTQPMTQRIVTDPIHRAQVGAAFRGESGAVKVSFDQLVERELQIVGRICELGGLERPSDEQVRKALRKAEAEWGGLTEYDRFLLGGLRKTKLLPVFYDWNDDQAAQGLPTLKLGHEPNGEWWRTNSEVESLPTQVGILRQDLGQAMRPTDLAHRPFGLSFDEQVEWAHQQGGDHLTSVEETLYLGFRSVLERGQPLWTAGWARCRNADGRGISLGVGWVASGGLYVGYGDRTGRRWSCGALVRKFVAL